jgi:EmrB/QacA subfamily drug resistance transporter
MINRQDHHTVQNVALLVTTMGAFLAPFMSSSINIALPAIGKEFAMNAVLLGWVATSYLLAAAIFLIPFGKIADMYGRKKIFTYGMGVYTVSSFLSAVAPSAMLLIGFRIFQGLGSAMIFGTGIAILTSVFPAEERGKAIGINVAATYSGLSVGPVLGGVLTQHFGWHSIFLVNALAGIIILVGVIWKLQGEWAGAKEETFDWIGSIISSVILIAIMVGFSRLPAMLGVWLILVGIATLLAFVWWEMRVVHPVLNMNLFKHSMVFAFSNLAALINYSATFAIGFLLSLYLQYIKGLSPQRAGLILVAQPVMQAVFSPYAGRLSDRIESRTLASTGMGLTVVGLSLLSLLNANTPTKFIIAALMLLGFGFALFSSPNTNAVMSSVEKQFYGIASATLAAMRLIGQTFSIGIAMLIFTLYIGKVQITPEYHAPFLISVKTAFLIFAFLCFGGIFASLARGKVR